MRVAKSWLLLGLPCLALTWGMSDSHRLDLRDQVRELFIHGYEGYMTHAYPADELRPVTCKPLWRDPDPSNFGINDIHANASITLLDVLSTLPLIHPSAFPKALELVATRVSFDQNVKVQVFEMTIRAMGALLSTFQYLAQLPDGAAAQAEVLGLDLSVGGDKVHGDLKRYKGRMLELAYDLGKKMLPAFVTPSGLPFARVNLRKGVEKGESVETCTAGAGSLVLEFTVLSRLTGDTRFETLASKAYLALWNRRSTNDLLGNTIGVNHGQWLVPGLSGVGAGMDSFFEYGMKAAILLGDDTYLDIFQDAYAAIQTHVRTPDGFIYRPTQFRTLQASTLSTIDSLSAFFPGVQVLAGDLESAIKGHLVFWNIWRKYDAMPESWNWEERGVEWGGWPGRPEFVEATYYLFQATRDPFYLKVGERVLKDMTRRTKTGCGFATLKNVETDELEDRMESFVLSETLKYLYLLFDPKPNPLLTNKVFTTEGHPLSLPISLQHQPTTARRELHRGENQQCPRYEPPKLGGLVVGIERRADYEYARSLVFGPGVDGRVVEDQKSVGWWEGGFCAIPTLPRHTLEIVLSPLDHAGNQHTPEDPSPSEAKVYRDGSGNFIIANIEGLRLKTRWRIDNRGYDVSSTVMMKQVGPHRVRPGQSVYVIDPKMGGYLSESTASPTEVIFRFFKLEDGERKMFLQAMGATAAFGSDFSSSTGGWRIDGGGHVRLVTSQHGEDGCSPLTPLLPSLSPPGSNSDQSKVIILPRGGCSFVTKLHQAWKAGYIGVLITGTPPAPLSSINKQVQSVLGKGKKEGLIRPSADVDDSDVAGKRVLEEVKGVGMIYVEYEVGEVLGRIMGGEQGEVEVEVEGLSEGSEGSSGGGGVRREGRLGLGEWEIWNLRIVERPP